MLSCIIQHHSFISPRWLIKQLYSDEILFLHHRKYFRSAEITFCLSALLICLLGGVLADEEAQSAISPLSPCNEGVGSAWTLSHHRAKVRLLQPATPAPAPPLPPPPWRRRRRRRRRQKRQVRPTVEHSDSDEGRVRGLAPSVCVTKDLLHAPPKSAAAVGRHDPPRAFLICAHWLICTTEFVSKI